MDFTTRLQEWHNEHLDHRLLKLPLMDGPTATIIIIGLYFLSVHLGPKFMKNRKPVNLTNFMYFYNLVQIALSLSFILLAMSTNRPFICSLYQRSRHSVPDKLSLMMYFNYVLRIFEFTDTMLLILKKKEQHLSYLHTYHHSANLLLAYLICQYMPGGSAIAVVTVNVTVHLIMYTYYFLSASPSMTLQKIALSFKKYLTQIQMIQFVYLCWLAVGDVLFEECGGSFNLILGVSVAHFVTLLVLFYNFYRKSYRQRGSENKIKQ